MGNLPLSSKKGNQINLVLLNIKRTNLNSCQAHLQNTRKSKFGSLPHGSNLYGNSTKFERIHVTKMFQKTSDSSVEEQKVFSNSFRQAGTPHKSSRKTRKYEQSYKEKLKHINKSQRKSWNSCMTASPCCFMIRMTPSMKTCLNSKPEFVYFILVLIFCLFSILRPAEPIFTISS